MFKTNLQGPSESFAMNVVCVSGSEYILVHNKPPQQLRRGSRLDYGLFHSPTPDTYVHAFD